MHVHLDHDSCLEVSVLRGPSEAVIGFADAVTTQRGVCHPRSHIIPVQVTTERHRHGARAVPHDRLHA